MTKILVIEDEFSLQENISEILEMEHYEVMCAKDGEQGIELVQNHSFDLILCDIAMPELDGYGVLTKVRSLPGMAMIPFIFLTARASQPDVRLGMELGADDYLTKPFTYFQLINAVRTRLNKYTAVSDHYKTKFDQLRSNISSSLPHELLTPLNGVIGLSEYLKGYSDSIDHEELCEVAELIHRSAWRFERVVQNTLLHAKLSLTASEPASRQTYAAIACQQPDNITCSLSKLVARRHEREQDLAFHLNKGTISISKSHLEKIVEELVDNACKFSDKGTLINITCELVGRNFILEVSDRGRGMTPAQIADIGAYMQFERKIYEQQGSGLGLVIVRQLVDLYSGHLEITSTLDKTSVRVTLPVVTENY